MAAVFYHNEEQKKMAEESRDIVAKKLGGAVKTSIFPVTEFYLAEDYHQKYRLRQFAQLEKEFLTRYPRLRDFVDSTAVTRVNGYVAGHGTADMFRRELPQLGLSDQSQKSLIKIVGRLPETDCRGGACKSS